MAPSRSLGQTSSHTGGFHTLALSPIGTKRDSGARGDRLRKAVAYVANKRHKAMNRADLMVLIFV